MAHPHQHGDSISTEISAQASAPPDFDEVWRRFSPYVARIGYRLLGRDDEVDDLVQDVFLAAHRGMTKLREPEAIRGWLATVTVRTAHRRLRKRRALAFFHLDDAPECDHVSHDASPEQCAEISALYRVLDSMPAAQRVPWALHHVENETLECTASLCNCSLATVKRRIKAAQDIILEATIGNAAIK